VPRVASAQAPRHMVLQLLAAGVGCTLRRKSSEKASRCVPSLSCSKTQDCPSYCSTMRGVLLSGLLVLRPAQVALPDISTRESLFIDLYEDCTDGKLIRTSMPYRKHVSSRGTLSALSLMDAAARRMRSHARQSRGEGCRRSHQRSEMTHIEGVASLGPSSKRLPPSLYWRATIEMSVDLLCIGRHPSKGHEKSFCGIADAVRPKCLQCAQRMEARLRCSGPVAAPGSGQGCVIGRKELGHRESLR